MDRAYLNGKVKLDCYYQFQFESTADFHSKFTSRKLDIWH